MHRLFQVSTIVSLSLLTGCASLITGTSQNIMVETQPAGADCRVTKAGALVAEVPSTPGYVRVHRGSNGLEIACTKPGYAVAQVAQPTEVEAWLFGNAFIGGLVGIAVDFTTGAAYRYDDSAMLAMQTAPYGQGPVVSSAGPATGNNYAYQQLTRVYPSASDASDPLIAPPATPQGDVTYHWHSAE